MPIYEYHCQDCGETFEKLVRWSEVNSSPECPSCSSERTEKRISNIFASTGGTEYSYSPSSSCNSKGRFT